jgi:hypothetical protein
MRSQRYRGMNCRGGVVLGLAALSQALLWAQQGPTPQVQPWPQDNKPPQDLQGNYVFLNQPADQIVVVIPGTLRGQPDQPPEIVRMVFNNRFDPQVKVSLVQPEPHRYRYLYSFSNGRAAKDAVADWTIVAPCQDPQFAYDTPPAGWHCGKAPSGLARQFALPHISGLACHATCYMDSPHPPGSAASQVTLVSGHKPGLTTASAGGVYPPFPVQFDWPDVILSQLSNLGDAAWSKKHVVTVGPRFTQETPIPAMASDFLQGLNELIRTGRLADDSRFVRDLKTILTQISEDNRGQISYRIGSSPSTDLEGEILSAVRLSLGLDPPAR